MDEQKDPKTKQDPRDERIAKQNIKLFDLEGIFCSIETINNLFAPFAIENCPEGIIVSELISKKLDEAREILYAE